MGEDGSNVNALARLTLASLPLTLASLPGSVLALAGGFLFLLAVRSLAAPIGYQAVPRDAFPVFDNPKMLTAAEAEARRLIFERDAVIGVSRGREAKRC